jgi:hypothetical protein
MGKALIKRDDGTALIMWAVVNEEMIAEGGYELAPDDSVDGKKVKDFDVGVHAAETVILADGTLIPDWTPDRREVDSEET